MLDYKIVRNYSQVLSSAMKDLEQKNSALKQLVLIGELIRNNNMINELFCSPIIDNSTKIAFINLLAKHCELGLILQKFLSVLVKNSRFNLFPSIIDEFKKLLLESNGIKLVDLVSAFGVSKKELEELQNLIEKQVGQRVEIQDKVQESLIGGIVVKYDSKLIDCSVLGALNKIEKIAIK